MPEKSYTQGLRFLKKTNDDPVIVGMTNNLQLSIWEKFECALKKKSFAKPISVVTRWPFLSTLGLESVGITTVAFRGANTFKPNCIAKGMPNWILLPNNFLIMSF